MRDHWVTKVFKKKLINLLVLMIVSSVSMSASGQADRGIPGDYGDAPDGELSQYTVFDPNQAAAFPSLFSDGVDARFILHRNPIGSIILGPDFTIEEDALLVDRDVDDGWIPSSFEVCSQVQLELFVRVPEELKQEDGPYYLNALFDWDHDGRWSGASACLNTNDRKPPIQVGTPMAQPIPLGWSTPEWVIQNLRLDQPPFNVAKGFAGDVLLPFILTGPEKGEMWIRYTVTTEPIDEDEFVPAALGGEGWDGRGDFEFGETEDYFSCLLQTRDAIFGNCSDNVLLPPTAPPVDRNSGSEADLEITKVDLSNPVVPGQNLTYSIRVTNDGPSFALGVVLTDTLPQGVTLQKAQVVGGNKCGNNGNVVSCVIGQMQNNEVVVVQITVLVDASFSGNQLTNIISVTTGVTDPIIANNTAILTTPVQGP